MLVEDLAVLWLPSNVMLLHPMEQKIQGIAGTVATYLCTFIWGSWNWGTEPSLSVEVLQVMST